MSESDIEKKQRLIDEFNTLHKSINDRLDEKTRSSKKATKAPLRQDLDNGRLFKSLREGKKPSDPEGFIERAMDIDSKPYADIGEVGKFGGSHSYSPNRATFNQSGSDTTRGMRTNNPNISRDSYTNLVESTNGYHTQMKDMSLARELREKASVKYNQNKSALSKVNRLLKKGGKTLKMVPVAGTLMGLAMSDDVSAAIDPLGSETIAVDRAFEDPSSPEYKERISLIEVLTGKKHKDK